MRTLLHFTLASSLAVLAAGGSAMAATTSSGVSSASMIASQQANNVLEKNRHLDRQPVKGAGLQATVNKSMHGMASGTASTITTISISGNLTMPSKDIEQIVAPLVVNGVKAGGAEQIRTAVENFCRKDGLLLPVVSVRVQGSTLSVQIIEGGIKDVVVLLGDKTRDKKVLDNANFMQLVADIEMATPIRTRQLERYITLMNRIHGLHVEYEVQPLAQPQGTEVANVILKVSTERGKASISADNLGLKETGKYQLTANAQAYNVFSNDSLIVQAGTSDKPNKFQMYNAGYLKRLSSYGTSLSVLASYIKNNPYGSGSQFSTTKAFKGRFDQYLISNADHSVKLEVAAEERKIAYFATNNGSSVNVSQYKYWLGSVGGKIRLTDFTNTENFIYPYYNWTLGGVHYNKASLQQQNFDKHFGFWTVDWYRTQFLPHNFSFFAHASYQQTNDKLPLDRQYAIGSYNTIQGYKVGLVSGNQGITGNVELRYTKEFKGHTSKCVEAAQPYLFYGATHFISPNKKLTNAGNVYFNKSTFQAAGVGVRLYFPHKFYGEAVAAQPLTRSVIINGTKFKNSTMYNFMLNKEFTW